jgi:hypothetical protein
VKLKDKKWRESYLAVIGPMFSKEDSRSAMGENFLLGIRAWIKFGQLRPDTPFVSEAIALLSHLAGPAPENLRISAVPATQPERLIALAQQLSLQVASAPTGQ